MYGGMAVGIVLLICNYKSGHPIQRHIHQDTDFATVKKVRNDWTEGSTVWEVATLKKSVLPNVPWQSGFKSVDKNLIKEIKESSLTMFPCLSYLHGAASLLEKVPRKDYLAEGTKITFKVDAALASDDETKVRLSANAGDDLQSKPCLKGL